MTREDYIKHITAEAEAKYEMTHHDAVRTAIVKRERAAHIAAKLSMWPLVQQLVDACVLVQHRRGPFHRDIEAERAIAAAKDAGFTPTPHQ